MCSSDKIQTVRKESVFSEQVTESEQAIIEQRVALQQRQYQAFERKEKSRKIRKVKDVYDYLTSEEIMAMLDENENDEVYVEWAAVWIRTWKLKHVFIEQQEVIVRLTLPAYLHDIRKMIALKHAHHHQETNYTNTMSEEQQASYTQLLEKRSKTLKKTTDDTAKQWVVHQKRHTVDIY